LQAAFSTQHEISWPRLGAASELWQEHPYNTSADLMELRSGQIAGESEKWLFG
jgi:hypothetical protein